MCWCSPRACFLGLLAAKRGMLPHDAICPSCGGWGAGLAVAKTGLLLVACTIVLLRTIRLPGTRAAIVLSSLAVLLAAGYTLLAIGFYFAIQA